MPSFSWLDVTDVPFIRRYSSGEWVGHQVWSAVHLFTLSELREVRLRLTALRHDVNFGLGLLKCPRVFVLHRQADKDDARRIAELASKCGFQYWLDVLDPPQEWLAQNALGSVVDLNYKMLVGSVVETALLNCSHVISLVTPHSPGTTWEAYAYGRVKDGNHCTLQAASWLHPERRGESLEDYMLQGELWTVEEEITRWFEAEMEFWRLRFRHSCPPGASEPWKGGRTRKLPKPKRK